MRKFISLESEALPDTYDLDSLAAQPIVDVKESEKRIDIDYWFPGLFKSENEHTVKGLKMRFDAIDIGGAGFLTESGRPLLPFFGRYVAIPPGCSYSMKVSTSGKPVKVENVLIEPAQGNMNDGIGPHEFEYDDVFYTQDQLYPTDLVTVSGPIAIDDYTALLIHVRPVQYNPKRRQLIGHPRIKLTIDLSQQGKTSADEANTPSEGREAYGNFFLNPRRNVGPRVGLDPGIVMPVPVGPEFLIYYAAPFQNAAARLQSWKNHRGLMTDIVPFTAGTSIASLKTDIRRRRAARGSRLRYVLLFGDIDDIPTETSELHNHTDYYCSTSEDYSTATPLPLPKLALGRIPVRTAAEGLSVVDQIIAYERRPPEDSTYYRRFVCAAHFEGSGGHETRGYMETMETIRAYLTSLGYDAERIYTSMDPNPTTFKSGAAVPPDVVSSILPAATATQRIIAATTEGHLIIAHRDHGERSGWYMPPFHLLDLDQVSGTMPSIFYSLNCLTGEWDATITDECFAEKVLRLPGTAPSLIASTELSNTILNNAQMLALFDSMYGGLLPTFPGSTASYPIRFNRLGDIHNYSRSYLPLISSDTLTIRSHFEMYHVLGDPSIEVWAREPRSLKIKARITLRGLEVELSESPKDCVVTIWLQEKLLKRISPASQRFVVPSSALPTPLPPIPASRVITISAWAPSYLYAEARVQILPVIRPRVVGSVPVA